MIKYCTALRYSQAEKPSLILYMSENILLQVCTLFISRNPHFLYTLTDFTSIPDSVISASGAIFLSPKSLVINAGCHCNH